MRYYDVRDKYVPGIFNNICPLVLMQDAADP